MRHIVAFNRITADGYFAAADGGLDWAVPDDEIDQSGVDAMPGAGTILFGRKTYEAFESFWPTVLDSPKTPDPHHPGRHSPTLKAMAVWIDQAKKIVFSRSRKEVTWKNSELYREFDAGQIETLKKQPGKNMMLFGSGSIASLLTEHDLIDEYVFIVNPVLLGSGRTLLNGVSKRTGLELAEAKPHPSGNLTLRYKLRR